MEKVRLNNGINIPAIGLKPDGPSDVKQAVKNAIDLGYRLFDCGHIANNQRDVGEAIKGRIKQGVIGREEVFLVGCTNDCAEGTLLETLNALGVDYLDLYLLRHRDDSSIPVDWKWMEEVYRKRMVRAIGLLDFDRKQVDLVLSSGLVMPSVNVCHLGSSKRKLRDFCDTKGIKVCTYSRLTDFHDANIKKIAERYDKSPLEIVFKYQLQLGTVPIVQMDRLPRIPEDFQFYLAPEDMALINAMSPSDS